LSGRYTPPQGARKHFGAVLVGYYDDKKLVFAGKVGTGFDGKTLSMLHKKFREKERDDCPFVDLPSKQNRQWVQGITPSMMKKMHWVNPKFVAEVKFLEWTRDGKLRAPVFVALREDKKPTDVVREGGSQRANGQGSHPHSKRVLYSFIVRPRRCSPPGIKTGRYIRGIRPVRRHRDIRDR